jgi:AcrR family transcriptional regulator
MSSTRPSRPVLRARYDEREAAVVAAAARVFAERGFHATSMNDLVRATGLTSGGLYHYIGSKDQLLVRICDQLMEPLLEETRPLVDSDEAAEALLRRLVRTWTKHVERNHDHMLVFTQERHVLEHGPQWSHVRGQRKEFEEILDHVLERGEREGAFTFADRDLALRALMGMVNHTAQWFRPGGRLTSEEVADGCVDLLIT